MSRKLYLAAAVLSSVWVSQGLYSAGAIWWQHALRQPSLLAEAPQAGPLADRNQGLAAAAIQHRPALSSVVAVQATIGR